MGRVLNTAALNEIAKYREVRSLSVGLFSGVLARAFGLFDRTFNWKISDGWLVETTAVG